MTHALPRGRFGQRAIQIDADPALLIGRAGGRDALGRHRLSRRLAEVRRGRLRSEEGTKPREHALTVGIGRAGARIEVRAAPRAVLNTWYNPSMCLKAYNGPADTVPAQVISHHKEGLHARALSFEIQAVADGVNSPRVLLGA